MLDLSIQPHAPRPPLGGPADFDRQRAAVQKADWCDPEGHPKIEAFCRHYGTIILPIRPYTRRHKGKVQRGVGYVQDDALRGRHFGSLADENRHSRSLLSKTTEHRGAGAHARASEGRLGWVVAPVVVEVAR